MPQVSDTLGVFFYADHGDWQKSPDVPGAIAWHVRYR